MFGTLLGWLKPRWSVVIFWAIPLDGLASRSTGGPRRRAVADVGPAADADQIIAVARAANLTATEAADRLTRGSHCVVLVADGEIATTCWVSAGGDWIGEIGERFVPGDKDAYIWDCATKPIYQGHHLYPALLREILQRLAADGFRHAWIATEWRNWRSARGVTRAGFRPVAVVVSVEVAGWRWHCAIPDPGAPAELVSSLKLTPV